MEINFELEQNDLVEFYQQYAQSQSSHKPLVYMYTTMFYIFIFADLFYLLFSGWGNFKNFDEIFVSIILRFGVGLFLMLGIYLISVLMQKRAANKIESVHNNGILCEHKIIFDENEFTEITDVNTTKHSWLSIGEIKELDDFVFINVNFVGTHFIPKRYFENQQHINEFVETAQYYHQSAKGKFNPSHLASFEQNLSESVRKRNQIE
ncbi:MAG: YcxB family protein [Acidobacteriota bacterium]|jgi:hypothetical protein|nr:YcxB family protein [Acidobacteriota bacterium]